MDVDASNTRVNGVPASDISVFDRGLAYGHGLFETIRFDHGRPQLWDAHLERLRSGCDRLAIPWLEQWNEQLLTESAQLCGETDGVIKIIITAGTGGRGYRAPDRPQPVRIVSLHPLPENLHIYSEQGIAVCTCEQRLSDQPQLAGLKHLNRLDQVLASREWPAKKCREGFMLDQSGFVVEGTRTNLFAVERRKLFTPILDRCGVSGVMRAYLMSEAVKAGLTVEEGRYTPQELSEFSELFVCNSVIGIWPVRSWLDKQYTIGRITRMLQQRVGELQEV